MTKETMIQKIGAIVGRIASEKGLTVPPIADETVLLESTLGIDSLDLAALVVELSEATGRDPFHGGFIEFRTVGQLADLYVDKNGE